MLECTKYIQIYGTDMAMHSHITYYMRRSSLSLSSSEHRREFITSNLHTFYHARVI
jgi:hypothetical protein